MAGHSESLIPYSLLGILFRLGKSGRSNGRGPALRRLRFEGCEERRLLVGIGGFVPGVGLLALTGSAGDDVVTVVERFAYVDIYSGGTLQKRLRTANTYNVRTITFNGGGGDDSLEVRNDPLKTGGDRPPAPDSLAIRLTGVEGLSLLTSLVNPAGEIVTSDGPLRLGTSRVKGTLDLGVAGDLTQSPGSKVAFERPCTLSVPGHDIALDNTANDFYNLAVTAARNVALCDVNTIQLGESDIAGDLRVQANLNSKSRLAVSQTGKLHVGGATTLTVGPKSTIALTHQDAAGADNELAGTVAIASGLSATLSNTLDTDLGPSHVTRDLTVISGGGITQSGPVVVGGTATLMSAPGSDITLADPANDFKIAAVQGENVTLADLNALALGKSAVAGVLDVTAGKAITQTGAVAAGSAAFNAGSSDGITLSRINDFTGSVSMDAGANVSLRNGKALELGESIVGGTLAVTAAGAITQSGPVTAAGRTTLAAGGTRDITLADPANDFAELAVTSGRNVKLSDANALVLGASKILGTLEVSAGGGLTQSGALTVGGSTTLASGSGDITLSNARNDFCGNRSLNPTLAVIAGNPAGQNVSLQDANWMVLGDFDVSGDLTLQANLNPSAKVALYQSAGTRLAVARTTTLAVGPASTVALDSPGNVLRGAVSIASAGQAALSNATDTDLGASSVAGNLTVSTASAASGGAITQSGRLVVGGVATVSTPAASPQDIALPNAANNFGALAVANARNVTASDVDALALGPATITGTLDVTADGAITQSGTLAVSGAATLAAGAAHDIALAEAANDFGSVGVVSGRNVALADKNAVALGRSTVSGTLAVTAAGAITQGGDVTVAGRTTLASGAANDIVLADAANRFSEVAVTSARDVTLATAGAMSLGTSNVAGRLTIASGGGLTQTGPVAVGGTTTLAPSSGNILLDDPLNDFCVDSSLAPTVVVAGGSPAGQNVSLRDANAMVLGTLNVSGDLSVQANLNTSRRTALSQSAGTAIAVGGTTTLTVGPASTISLDNAGNVWHGPAGHASIVSASNATLRSGVRLVLGASNVTENLSVTATGAADAIGQNGPLVVGQTATFSAAGADIVLTNAGNDFGAAAVTAARSAAIRDANALILGASTVSDTLDVTAAGPITQSGAIVVSGAATLSAEPASDIVLLDAANRIRSVGIATGRDVSLSNDDALTLNASNVSGSLAVTAAGDITQSGAVAVAGKATLAARTTNDIVLARKNHFNELSVTSGNNVTLANAGAMVLGTSNVAGTLTVTTGGGLTQSGPLTVADTTTLTATAGGITLTNAYNNFCADLSLAPSVAVFADTEAGQNVSLRDRDTVVLGASSISGSLAVKAGGAITQSDALSVAGATTLATSLASDITLALDNSLGELAVTSGRNVRVVNSGVMALGTSNISGTLTITAADLSQSGPVSVAGKTTLNVVDDIALDDASNDFTTVAVTAAQSVWLADANDLTLGASAVSGTLSVTAGGSISQSGAITVSGAATLSAGPASDIALLDPANDLSSPDGVGIDSGRNVALRSSGPLTLNPSSVSGTLAVAAAGAITQTGGVTVAGRTTLAAGAANDIVLAENNHFSELAVTSGRDVTLANAGPMVLGTSGVAGRLTVNTAGGLTQTGPLTIGGTATLTATAGNIALIDADNDFCADASLTPAVAVVADTEPDQNVSLRDKDTVVLGPSRIRGTLGVTAGGDISQSGVLAVTGATTLAASTSSDILLGLANSLTTVSVASGKDVTLTNAGAIILGASSVSGMLRVNASGLSQSGPVIVAGNTILNVTSDITLQDGGNDFDAITVTAARNLSLGDANSVDLGGVVVSGDLRIEAGGAITDSGVVSVVGRTTLVAGGDILLDTPTSVYQGVLSLAGNNVSVTNDRATVLGDSTVTGDLAVLANGSLTNLIEPGPPLGNGAITVLGRTTLNAGSNPLTLYLARCRFVGVIYVTGDPVDIIPAE